MRDTWRLAIRRLSAVGGTALYDAVVRVLNDLRPVKVRKAIVVFSDGAPERPQAETSLDTLAGL